MKVSGKPAASTRRADQASKQQGTTTRPGAASSARSFSAGDVVPVTAAVVSRGGPRARATPRIPSDAMQAALAAVLELLDLEELEVNLFRGRSPQEGSQRVFGGQVLGQALVAAGRSVPDAAARTAHSLHAYFVRPGDPAVPILYQVDRTRDGRSFTTRRVVAIQRGRAIFHLEASFHGLETGPEHQDE